MTEMIPSSQAIHPLNHNNHGASSLAEVKVEAMVRVDLTPHIFLRLLAVENNINDNQSLLDPQVQCF